MTNGIRISQLFQSLPVHWSFRDVFSLEQPIHTWIPLITEALRQFFAECKPSQRIRSKLPPHLSVTGDVYIGRDVSLPSFGTIEGPAYIDDECILRPSVYIRGNVIVGRNCVLGNSCEFKNSLLLEHVQVPHFNYVGDSILGNGAHLGAGCILSNLRLDQKPVCMQTPTGEQIQTGLRKLGAVLGDGAQAGCNAVLQPGSCLFPNAVVYPCESLRERVSPKQQKKVFSERTKIRYNKGTKMQ
jgi:NDP-sugar pyrophosphorylase family protein